MKVYRGVGKRGRVTIPFEIRHRAGIRDHDMISFSLQDDGTVIIRKEKICDDCVGNAEGSLMEFLEGLTVNEQRLILISLAKKWAKERGWM